jgi:hypothetical protein
MWIFMARPARPDAFPWAGRRAWALIDAIAWPALWIALIANAPFTVGVVGWTAMGLVCLAAVSRARRALWRNERYWFTTRRWGVPFAALLAVGFAIRLLA